MTTPTASSAPVRRVQVHDIGQLAACVPYLLGYDPVGGIVALGMSRSPDGRPTRVIGPSARVSLERVDLTDDTLGEGAVADLAEALWDLLAHRLTVHAEGIVLLGWLDGSPAVGAPGADRLTKLVHGIADCAEVDGMRVLDLALVGDGCWRPVTCDDPRCCPSDLIELPAPHQVRAITELVAEGRSPLRDRDAVLAQVALVPGSERARLVRSALRPDESLGPVATARCSVEPEAGLAAWRRLLALDGVVRQDEAGWAADVADAVRLVEDVRARDVVLGWLCPVLWTDTLQDPALLALARRHLGPRLGESERRDQGDAVLERMLAVCQAVPDPEAGPAVTLTGMLAWAVGATLVAEGAFERATTGGISQSLAAMMLGPVRQGLTYAEMVRASQPMG